MLTLMSPSPLRAGLYARIRREDALDLPMQGHALESFAAMKGWTVALKVLEAVPEHATRLPALDRLLRAAHGGQIEVVVAWKLDRLARSLPELIERVELLAADGVAVATVADDVNLAGEAGRELRRIFRVLGALHRTAHRDQVKEGLASARQRGTRVGRPATSEVHRAEARRLAAEGLSLREIGRRLELHPKTVGRLVKER